METQEYQTTSPQEGQKAFWPYDLFPYVLSGTVQSTEGVTFQTKEYGGMRFTTQMQESTGPYTTRPSNKKVVFLDSGEGEAIARQLKELEGKYHRAKDELHQQFVERAREIAPFLSLVSPNSYK